MNYCKYLFLTLLVCAPLQANEMRFDNFNVEDGLNHEVVRGIVQGPAGFLWIATEGGLIRFDGFAFVEFKYSDGDKQTNK